MKHNPSIRRMNCLHSFTGVAAVSLLAAPARAQGDAARLQPYTAEYEVLAQGRAFGRATVTLAREGDGWKHTLSGALGSVRQTATAVWGPAWEPRTYGETYVGDVEGHTEVRLENGRFTGTARMPPQAGGSKTFDEEAADGAVWSPMDQVMLSTADLAEGRVIVIPVFTTSTGVVLPVKFTVGAAESVTVPAGTFRAYRVESEGGAAPLVCWMRVEGPHIVIKQELVGQPVTVQLKSFR